MKKLIIIISIMSILITGSCSFKKTTTPVKTTVVTENTTEKQYQQAIQKLISDAVALSVEIADYENRKQIIDQQIAGYTSQIVDLQGKIDNLQINYNNKVVEYQQLAQDYANLQNGNSKLDNSYKDLFDKFTFLKNILFAVSNGTGLASANMTADEKSALYTLFHKWYVNELPIELK